MVVLTFLTRPRSAAVVALVSVLLPLGPGVAAQQPNDDRCRAALIARGVAANRISAKEPCHDLAAAIQAELSAKAYTEPRDVQSSGAGSAAPAGSPAQSSAVPTIQPASLVSATVAAVAQDSGSTAITSVSINPAMLFSSTTDPDQIARISRLLDVSVFFPVDGLDRNKDGRLDYAGVRLRVNFTASAQASALQREVRQRLTAILRNELGMVNEISAVLHTAPAPAECANQLTKADAATEEIVAACGAQVGTHVDDAAYAALRRAARTAREEADARYLGLDLRFDTGDPTLGKVRNAAGTAIVAGLGFGRRFDPAATGATGGLRGRLGVRYMNLRDTTLVDWQVDGGLALEAARLVESQRLEMSAGFEFRFSGNRSSSQILRTRYTEFRAAVNVPIAGSTSIALSGSAPIMGDISPTLSVSMNWQQLLAGAMSRR